jgi:two-component system, OmpR family, alkaline phosphatase synthesis response regulator PhoP
MKAKILLIEDEKGLVITLTDRLECEGYEVMSAKDGEAGYQKALTESYDLLILDLMLPNKDGLDICRDLRTEKINVPIIMLTAKGQLLDKVVGFKLGADDYLTKPFEMLELLSRIEALLRRSRQIKSNTDPVYRFDDYTVIFNTAELVHHNRLIELTAKEFKLLHFFITHQGQVLSRDQLLDAVWEYNSSVTTRTVDVHVSWLRQKLEKDPSHPVHIITIHGTGYKFKE